MSAKAWLQSLAQYSTGIYFLLLALYEGSHGASAFTWWGPVGVGVMAVAVFALGTHAIGVLLIVARRRGQKALADTVTVVTFLGSSAIALLVARGSFVRSLLCGLGISYWILVISLGRIWAWGSRVREAAP